jgi:GntR family histidine utilization transcriptional repressor
MDSPAPRDSADFALDGKGPLFRQIERAITGLILRGAYRSGDRLPSEAELTDMFSASRQTINKAITELAKHGLVVRNRRAGTMVSERFQESFRVPLPDVSEVVSARGGIYAFRILKRERVTNGRAGMTWTAVKDGAPLLYLEVLHTANGAAVQLETRLVNLEAVPWIADESFAETPPGKWLLANIPWSSVRHKLLATTAGTKLAGILGIAAGSACLVVERQTFHLSEPITSVQMTHPGDRFQIEGDFALSGFENSGAQDKG